MNYFKSCPACHSKALINIKNHHFKYPGDDIQQHLDDINFERLWILFNRIFKQKGDYTFETLQCINCGLIFLNPRLDDEEIRIKYDTINDLGGVKYRFEHDKIVKQGIRAKTIFKLVNSFVAKELVERPRILDIGGASGYILEPFRMLYDCNIIDFEKWPLPEGIHYRGKQLNDLPSDELFDVILLLHTLEHIMEPQKMMEEISERLTNKGILYIEVPLGAFQEWKYISDPITHVNFFSEQSLYSLFKSSGFDVNYLSSSYQRVTRAKTWCLNILGTKNQNFGTVLESKIASTNNQMYKFSYFLPYIFHKRAYKKIMKKLLTRH